MKEVNVNDYQKMAMETAIYPLPIISSIQYMDWLERQEKLLTK